MTPTPYQPLAFFQAGWTHRRLVLALARRKIEARYRGSTMGVAWAVLQPLILLAVYTFVFSIVLQARWDVPSGEQTLFALIVFSGMILYGVFSECVNEAPQSMLANRTYIQQVLFPIEILPWVDLLTALFGFTLSSLMLAVFYLMAQGPPPLTCLYLPFIVFPVLLLTLGASWWLASLGVFLRDVGQLVGLATTALLFLSPIFYPASRIPEAYQTIYHLNPFVDLLEMSRGSLFYGRAPDPLTLLAIGAGAWFVAWLGYLWFMLTKKGFSDVL